MNIIKNRKMFAFIAKTLNDKGADIQMEVDPKHWKDHKEIKFTNVPRIRRGTYNSKEGFYFRAAKKRFGIGLNKIKKEFPMYYNGFKIECVGINEFEIDDDRYYHESVDFTINKLT